jgi:hypothetical protein
MVVSELERDFEQHLLDDLDPHGARTGSSSTST